MDNCCFVYYDRDYFLNAGCFPIIGEHYACLLRYCFRYAAYVSFVVSSAEGPLLKRLDQWRVCKEDNDSVPDEFCTGQRRLYCACEELRQEMLDWTSNLFDLCAMGDRALPEDPVFLRQDGSVFFDSTIHEGECFLYPQNGESVEAVLAYARWLPVGADGRPSVPAKDHQLPYPSAEEMYGDQLYRELVDIKKTPLDHIPEATADAICRYVENYRPYFLQGVKELPSGMTCVPNWYQAFEMFVLGECNAMTFTPIPDAICRCGYRGVCGFHRFFELLEQYAGIVNRQGKENP